MPEQAFGGKFNTSPLPVTLRIRSRRIRQGVAVSSPSAVRVNRVEFGFGGRRKGCGFESSGGHVSGLLRRRGLRDVT